MNVIFNEGQLLQRASEVPYVDITLPEWRQAGVNVVLRRDDLIDSQLSGNKLYKLYFNLAEAEAQGKDTIVSYGGAYSNHLYSLAAAGQSFGFKTIGIVRGEEPRVLNPTLSDAKSKGMQVRFVSRDYYRKVSQKVNEVDFPDNYFAIPEGGANLLGLKGSKIIGKAIKLAYHDDYDTVCLAVGTGTTMAGLVQSLPIQKLVVGFSVLKGNDFSFNSGQKLDSTTVCAWRMIRGFHGGGYGRKLPLNLLNFWQKFEQENKILIDPVYTLKMLWGIHSLILQGYWPCGARLLAVHTGGIQGRRGFASQLTW